MSPRSVLARASTGLLLLALAGAAAADPPVVQVGEVRETSLDRGQSRATIRIPPGPAERLTLIVSSLDFDPAVEVRADGGDVVGYDDDSGGAFDAWLTVERPEGLALLVDVDARDGRSGEFNVDVRRGRHEPPSGAALRVRRLDRFVAIGRRAAESGDAGRAGRFLVKAGGLLRQYGRGEEAVHVLSEALPWCERADDDGRTALALALLGAVERARRNTAAAAAALLRATDLYADLPPRPDACFAWEELGRLHLERSECDEAVGSFERFRDTAEAIGEPALAALATARIASAHELEGAFDAAHESYDEAVDRIHTLRTPAPHYEATVLTLAGWYHAERGNLREARTLLDRAVQLVPAESKATRIDTQRARALVFSRLGRHENAAECLRSIEPLLDDDDPRVLLPLAIVASELRNTGRALEWLGRATASLRPGADDDLLLDARAIEAEIRLKAGEHARVREIVEATLPLLDDEAASTLDRRFRLTYYLARVEEETGDLAAAADRFAEARAIAARTDNESHVAKADAARAYVALLRGDVATAKRLATAAHDVLLAQGEVDTVLSVFHTLGAVALAEEDVVATRAILGRAHTLLDRPDLERLDANERATLRSRFAALSELAHDLAALEVRRAAGAPDPRAAVEAAVARGLAEAGRWKGRAILDALPRAAATRGPAAGPLEGLRAALGPDRTLLEYAEGHERLYVYRVSAADAALVDLGPKDALFARVEESRRGFDGSGPLAPTRDVVARGAALARDLLASALDGPAAAHLVLVPAGALATYPFEALVLDKGAGDDGTFDAVTFLGDRTRVTYAPSSVVFRRVSSLPPPATPDRLLFLADPVFASELDSGDTPRSGPDVFGLDRLEASRDEVLAIARALLLADPERDETAALVRLAQLEHDRSGPATTSRFDAFLGKDATISKLVACADGYAVLHLATHGHVDVEDPARSGLVLSFEDDTLGFFSLADVLELPLDARLTVLSACDTARGRLLRGEGVQSLAHAFLRAGSRAVVATLWKVRDVDAEATMTEFYAGFVTEGLPPSEALRRAKAKVRREGVRGQRVPMAGAPASDAGHPYYWAPFVYSGALDPVR